MTEEPGATPSDRQLQFDHAEYEEGLKPATACSQCNQPLSDSYYLVNDRAVCGRCRYDVEMAERQGAGGGFARFVRATLYGLLAAAVGAAIWFGIRAVTNWELGLIAVVVGFMVGAAVRAGSRGRGGWRYQTLAVFLTYSAVAATYVPIIVKALKEQATKTDAAPAEPVASPSASSAGTSAPASSAPVAPAADTSASPAAADSPAPRPLVLVLGLVAVLILAYVGPFLQLTEGLNGLIGLAIVSFAVYEAWKINKRTPLVISGPFRLAQTAPLTTPTPADDGR